jgi:hypothetical protein
MIRIPACNYNLHFRLTIQICLYRQHDALGKWWPLSWSSCTEFDPRISYQSISKLRFNSGILSSICYENLIGENHSLNIRYKSSHPFPCIDDLFNKMWHSYPYLWSNIKSTRNYYYLYINDAVWNTLSNFLHFVDRASCNDSWQMINVRHKFLSMYLYLFITLYMFRALRTYHQERQIVSIQPLVTVTLCWWPCRVHGGSKLSTCTRHGPQHRVSVTRGCIDTICLSGW